MKILYVHAKGEVGGSDISLLTILKNIDKRRFTPNVIVAKKGPFFDDYRKYCDRCEEIKFSVLKSPDNFIEFLEIIIKFIPSIFLIWNIIKKWKVDVVHVNSVVIPSAIIASRLAGKPVIVHKREIIVSNKLASVLLDFINSLFSDKIIAISDAVRENSLKLSQKKMIVIYNGVDISEISTKRQNKFRKEYDLSNNTLLIGVFSRIEPWKGQHIVIKALPKVISKFKNVKVMIFGEPYTEKGRKYLEELKQLVHELNLDDIVLFPGVVKNLNDVYSDFDLVILPSVNPEPLGRVIIESMAAGRAVIATNLGGSRECVVNNKTGLLIKENDINEMKKSIIKILGDHNLRKSFGKLGRKRAEKIFDIKKIIGIFEEIYKNLYS